MTQSEKALCGFINILKPPGMTSSQAVGFVRRHLNGEKVGHGGTLDPEASGVLPLMIGKAARLFDYMQDKEKVYIAEVSFGASTDTQDAQGKVLEVGENYPSCEELEAVLGEFTGEIMQRPPIYSALKQDGKRLYQLARSGQSTDIPLRPATVYDLELVHMTENHGAIIRIRCAKGFYVRSLCHDLGQRLGCPSHMRFLLRAQSGVFGLDSAVTLEQIAKAKETGRLETLLLHPSASLGHLASLQIPVEMEKPLRNGGKLPVDRFPGAEEIPQGKMVCLWLGDQLLAIAERCRKEMKPRTWLGE
ncbi:MAG: tRNA pseudouridine(55) synthase TruB [Clostridiales bacterium]|nr:tRNA pseudouridine(55) synthase TruB [Clostridiales bacterium]